MILIFVGGGAVLAKAETIDFPYMNDQQGEYIKDGVTNGNTHNYDYGNVAGVSFDSEGYVNYDNKAYVKKSVKENAEKQGLFDVTLDVKGNDINPPRDIDLVLVIDFSSTMSGEKLLNTQNAVHQFLTSIAEVLQEGHVRVGLVCYNRNLYSTQTFSTDANYLDDFLVNGAKSQSGTFTQKGLIEAERMFTEDGRGDAEHMLVHIGDGSANRSYIPAPDVQIAHLSGIFPALSSRTLQTFRAFNDKLQENKVFTVFDPNLRPALWKNQKEMVDTLNNLAKNSQIVLPGINEGQILMGSSQPEKIADFYLSQSSLTESVVVKLGAEGAFVKTKAGATYTVSGFKVDKIVDTVGAGDGFAVGLESALLEGKTLEVAVHRACAIGALAVQSAGDSEGYPTRQELMDFYKSQNYQGDL